MTTSFLIALRVDLNAIYPQDLEVEPETEGWVPPFDPEMADLDERDPMVRDFVEDISEYGELTLITKIQSPAASEPFVEMQLEVDTETMLDIVANGMVDLLSEYDPTDITVIGVKQSVSEAAQSIQEELVAERQKFRLFL